MVSKFSKTMRDYRKAQGMTQAELACRAGVDHTYISKIENEKNAVPPSARLLRKVAIVFNVDPDFLIDLSLRIDTDALRNAVRYDDRLAYILRKLPDATYDQVAAIEAVLND